MLPLGIFLSSLGKFSLSVPLRGLNFTMEGLKTQRAPHMSTGRPGILQGAVIQLLRWFLICAYYKSFANRHWNTLLPGFCRFGIHTFQLRETHLQVLSDG